jgi:hypothetical protein
MQSAVFSIVFPKFEYKCHPNHLYAPNRLCGTGWTIYMTIKFNEKKRVVPPSEQLVHIYFSELGVRKHLNVYNCTQKASLDATMNAKILT